MGTSQPRGHTEHRIPHGLRCGASSCFQPLMTARAGHCRYRIVLREALFSTSGVQGEAQLHLCQTTTAASRSTRTSPGQVPDMPGQAPDATGGARGPLASSTRRSSLDGRGARTWLGGAGAILACRDAPTENTDSQIDRGCLMTEGLYMILVPSLRCRRRRATPVGLLPGQARPPGRPTRLVALQCCKWLRGSSANLDWLTDQSIVRA